MYEIYVQNRLIKSGTIRATNKEIAKRKLKKLYQSMLKIKVGEEF